MVKIKLPTIEKYLSIRLVGFISLGELPRMEFKAKRDERSNNNNNNNQTNVNKTLKLFEIYVYS